MLDVQRSRRDSVHSPLETYLRDINSTPLLSAQEEKDLAHRIEEGDAAARDHLVRANLRLVVNIARHYANRGLGLQDLVEEGNLGLLRAVEGYDPSMNTRFSTYACFWIKQSIRRALNNAKTIRLPFYMIELLNKWRKATAELHKRYDRPPTEEEIADHLGLSRKKLNIIRKAIQVYNASTQGDSDNDSWSFDEVLVDGRGRLPETRAVESDLLKHVLELVGELDPREAAVLRMRFGLQGGEPLTLKEIGDRLGLTRERVRQIEGLALSKLSATVQAE